jgi:hypothetical protein
MNVDRSSLLRSGVSDFQHNGKSENMRCGWLLLVLALPIALPQAAGPIDVGSRRELFVDDYLIERLEGRAQLRLHRPVPREVSLVSDAPWEGNDCIYLTVLQDGALYRMYYRGSNVVYTKDGSRHTHREVYCYAESADGVRWTKPDLGLFDFGGSKKNNIVWDGIGTHAFAPFKDANPACPPEVRYKALGFSSGKRGLYAFGSPDALHWTPLSAEPVITRGSFDSQNLAFWDTIRGEYREYHRDFRSGRDIRTSTSKDFLHWSEPRFLDYVPWSNAAGPLPDREIAQHPTGRPGQLYTNQVAPYDRAPHIFLGFPTRYLDRGWAESTKELPRYDYRRIRGTKSPREGTALTEGLLMASRDAQRFTVWGEAFLRPGLRGRDNWFYSDNYQNWGLVTTRSAMEDSPPEISIYVTEGSMQEDGARFRRHTLRIDGFVSVQAPLAGGELVTKPLVFQGNHLSLNFSTSAAGSIRVEVQDTGGQPIPGFALADCHEIFGDHLDHIVLWRDGQDAGKLAGKPVRLRFALNDADLFAFQFLP